MHKMGLLAALALALLGSSGAAVPFLKFMDGQLVPQQEGLARLRAIQGEVRVVAVIGDSRSGKSFLCGKVEEVCGYPASFLARPQSTPVTHGVDLETVQCHGQTWVILDCEGGDNTLGPIHKAINQIALGLAQKTVFVVEAKLGEDKLETLGQALASQTAFGYHQAFQSPELLVVVNNPSSFNGGNQQLEDVLMERHGGHRDETRKLFKRHFPHRQLFPIPLDREPDFQQKFSAFAEALLSDSAQLTVGGVCVQGPQLADLVVTITQQLNKGDFVDMPGVVRQVVFDGFLMPRALEIFEQWQADLPPLTKCESNVQLDMDGLLRRFDDGVGHLAQDHAALVSEARAHLMPKFAQAQNFMLEKNKAFCAKDCRVSTEFEKDVVSHKTWEFVAHGRRSLGLIGRRDHIEMKCRFVHPVTRARTTCKDGSEHLSNWVPGTIVRQCNPHDTRRTSGGIF